MSWQNLWNLADLVSPPAAAERGSTARCLEPDHDVVGSASTNPWDNAGVTYVTESKELVQVSSPCAIDPKHLGAGSILLIQNIGAHVKSKKPLN